jgi:hypothetical protein
MYLKSWGVCIMLIAGCAGPSQRLPAATSDYQIDNTLAFELPDSGGYLVNGMSLDTAPIREQLKAVFGQRPQRQRAVVVWYNPNRPWSDFQFIQREAREAGGEAFDAELSGWPKQVPAPQR